MERRRPNGFSKDVRDLAKKKAGGACEYCGSTEHLTVHHSRPLSHGGRSRLENAVVLDRKCHDVFDALAINHKIYFNEIKMELGKEYIIGLPVEHSPSVSGD